MITIFTFYIFLAMTAKEPSLLTTFMADTPPLLFTIAL